MKKNQTAFLCWGTAGIIFFSAFFAVSPGWAGNPLRLETVGISQKQIDTRQDKELVFSFKPSREAKATVKVYNRLGEPVKTVIREKEVTPESQTAVWDLTDESGAKISGGIYYYTVDLTSGTDRMIHNPYRRTQGMDVRNKTAWYDENAGMIHYELPQAAMVMINIRLKNGGPILATPLNWTAQPSGEYTVKWNGMDDQGVFNIVNHPNRHMMIYAYTLADNSIIVDGPSKETEGVFQPLTPEMMARQPFPTDLPGDRHTQARKDPRLNRPAKLMVEFPGSPINRERIPVLSGKTPVRVKIDPRDQWIVENSRYELMFYIDGVILFEDESAFAPFTFFLDTKDITPGEHVFTVNIMTYDGEYAVLSKKIMVGEDKLESKSKDQNAK